MTSLLMLVCLLTGSGLTLGVLWLAVRRGIRQLGVASAYRDVAERLGLEVDTRGTSVRGHLGQRRIWIGDVMEGHGTARRTACRGVISFERPLGLGLHVAPRSRFGRAPALQLGDADLDRRVAVTADEPALVRALFDGPARDALRTLSARCPELRVSDQDVQVWLKAPESDAGPLRALVDDLVRLATALDRARQAVPVPAGVEAWVEPWRKLAADLGLALEPNLPALVGHAFGRDVLVTARRDPDRFVAVAQVAFHPHPDLGLIVRPQVEPDGYWSVGQDIQVGDPAFDRAFVVKGYDPALVVRHLSPSVRARLLDLRAKSPLVLDDRAIYVLDAPAEPERLGPLLEQVAGLAAAMGW